MEGVDWMATLVGVTVMIAFCVVAFAVQALIDTMKRRETSEDEGPSTLGS
jgi:hypothetical protein